MHLGSSLKLNYFTEWRIDHCQITSQMPLYALAHSQAPSSQREATGSAAQRVPRSATKFRPPGILIAEHPCHYMVTPRKMITHTKFVCYEKDSASFFDGVETNIVMIAGKEFWQGFNPMGAFTRGPVLGSMIAGAEMLGSAIAE